MPVKAALHRDGRGLGRKSNLWQDVGRCEIAQPLVT